MALFATLCAASLFSGCSSSDDLASETSLEGKWVYVYDPETEGEPTEKTAVEFVKDGTLVWEYSVDEPSLAGKSIKAVGTWTASDSKVSYAFPTDEESTIMFELEVAAYKINGNTLTIVFPDCEACELQKVK